MVLALAYGIQAEVGRRSLHYPAAFPMTVELVVMNRKAAAVAADSAVTVSLGGTTKIFNTSSKIFAVSRCVPIAGLIYDGINVNGVPWETVLKEFRHVHGNVQDATVEHLGQRMWSYLAETPLLKGGEEIHVRAEVYTELRRILAMAGVQQPVAAAIEEGALAAAVVAREQYWDSATALPGAPSAGDVLARHGAYVADEMRRAFRGHDPTDDLVQRILRLLVVSLERWPDDHEPAAHTGLVVCGFGVEEEFPALRSWRISGVVCGALRAKADVDVAITHLMPAHVEAFAQPADVRAFLTGIQPQLRSLVERQLQHFLQTYARLLVDAAGAALTPAERDALVGQYAHDSLAGPLLVQLDRFSQEQFQQPIFEMTAALPKEELALMAEALVNLTSLRKRVTAEADTVGGPVDVALITRGDGLVWIKRKSYFDQLLNPHAAERYHP
jgi:hypothetical protein